MIIDNQTERANHTLCMIDDVAYTVYSRELVGNAAEP